MLPGEDGCAAVALAVRIVPVALIAIKVQVELPRLQLCLVEAEKVSVELVEDRLKAHAVFLRVGLHAGSEAIDIPGDELGHGQ
jgi:hypothetical protein